MTTAAFPVDNQLTSVSLAFRNTRFIADEALPRFPVGTMRYRYTVYRLEDGLSVHDDEVGRRGQPKVGRIHRRRADRGVR